MNKTHIIEFFGLPKTGKSTTVSAIKTYLKDRGLKVELVTERASECPIKDKLSPDFNFWTVTALFKRYLEAREEGVQILIADRGFLDGLVWINYFLKDNKESKIYQDFLKFISLYPWEDCILRAYFFEANTDKIFQREWERHVDKKFGRIMNEYVIGGYLNTYRDLKEDLFSHYSIKEVNTSIDSTKGMIDIVAKDLDDILKKILV